MVIVYMSFCAWCVYLTSGHEQEPENALRRDRWFSHMDNSLWLHWGARMDLNTQCTVHRAKWWALSLTSHSAVQLAAAVYVTLIVDPHGRPSGCWNYAPHFKSNEHFLDCKQYSYISYEYTHYWPSSGVTQGWSVLCCWWYFLQRSDLISGVLWRAASQMAQLGLGRWQWHSRFSTPSCDWLWVSKRWGGFVLDSFLEMEIQPTPPGVWLSKNELLESWILWRGTAVKCSQSCFYGSDIGGQRWVAHVLIMLFLSLWTAFKASFMCTV